MVRIFFLLVMSVGQVHAASLSLIPEKSQIERGRSVTVNMRYVGPITPDELNVKRWQTEVFVKSRQREEQRLPDGRIEVKQRLTLYPKSTGPITLGPLALGGAKSDRFDLIVTPALVNNVDITPIWTDLPEQMWQGESIESCIQMPLSEQRNRVKVEVPEIPGVSAEQTLSRSRSIHGNLTAERCWRFTYHKPGHFLMEMPPVIQRGRGRWTFYLPSQEVEVLPLPSYLPNNISVGKPDMTVQKNEQGWSISVESPGGQPSHTVWGLKSAIVKAIGVSADQILDSDGAIFVPFNEWSLGQTIIVKVPYFNTVSGRLDAVELPLKTPWKLPTLVIALLLSLGIAILIIATRVGAELVRRRENIQNLKRAINAATTADQIISILLVDGSANSGTNTQFKTLQQWADAQGDQEALALADGINQSAYGEQSEMPLNEIKRRLIKRLNG